MTNLYAEKIFAEHPLDIWTLDDNLSSTPVSQSIFTSFFTNKVIPTKSYLSGGIQGYYVADSSDSIATTARNTTLPLVYGSNNCVILTQNGTDSSPKPSMVIPAYGFLNTNGQYKTLTLEFWTRMNAQTSSPRKIVGPLSGDDGLYVDGEFLRFKIGNNIGSAYIQEWARPMLIQISISNNLAVVYINTEEVIRLQYITSSLSLSNQDWIAFYAYSEITAFEVDCISIYSYMLPKGIIQKHIVYGQGVEYPKDTVLQYAGKAYLFDYSFANAYINYTYPETGNWRKGIYDGISVDANILSFPKYELPSISTDGDINSFVADITTAATNAAGTLTNSFTPSFINLKPSITTDWTKSNSFIAFPKLNMIGQTVAGIWVTLGGKLYSSNIETLLKIQHNVTGDYFMIQLGTDGKLTYSYQIQGTSASYLSSIGTPNGGQYSVGLDIAKVSAINSTLNIFFQSANNLKVYVGGGPNQDKDPTTSISMTTTSNILSVSFSSTENHKNFVSVFDSNGMITDPSITATPFSKYATYTYLPQFFMKKYILDIATNAYWQDSIPLSFLTNFVIDSNGNTTNQLDYIQYNVNHPQPIFDNTTAYYNTSSNQLKMYALFQNTSDINILKGNSSSITTTVSSSITNTITPGSLSSTTRYELVDNVLIKPPTGVDPSLLNINLYFEFSTNAISQNPIKIMSLQLISQGASQNAVIGSKYGNNIQSDMTNAIGTVNTFLISKDVTPHLWLTSKSGIALLNDTGVPYSTGALSFKINPNASDDFKISLFQIMARWNYNSLPQNGTILFKITHNSGTVNFKVTSVNSNNVTITLQDDSGNSITNKSYVNGVYTNTITLRAREWIALSVSFANPLNFSLNNSALFSLTSNLNIENISYYQQDEYSKNQSYLKNTWSNSLNYGSTSHTWSAIKSNYTYWEGVKETPIITYLGVDPQYVYNSFIGINLIVFDSENLGILKTHNPEYQILLNTTGNIKTYSPT